MAQKLAPDEKIAQIYLPHLPLFASLTVPAVVVVEEQGKEAAAVRHD